jgi:hypothetical protein
MIPIVVVVVDCIVVHDRCDDTEQNAVTMIDGNNESIDRACSNSSSCNSSTCNDDDDDDDTNKNENDRRRCGSDGGRRRMLVVMDIWLESG